MLLALSTRTGVDAVMDWFVGGAAAGYVREIGAHGDGKLGFVLLGVRFYVREHLCSTWNPVQISSGETTIYKSKICLQLLTNRFYSSRYKIFSRIFSRSGT
jgi:hypothetical protein